MSLCVYRNNSLQPLDPFFDDEDDMPDCALVQPIPMQSTESHLPVVLRSSFAKYCASGVGSTRAAQDPYLTPPFRYVYYGT